MSFFIYAHCHNFAENISIMAIQNEVFKFVAELELDEKTKDEFTKGLKDANDRCDALRKSIVDQQKELLKLAAAGKEGSKAYQDL